MLGVVPCKPGSSSGELRYALRSWDKHVPSLTGIMLVGGAPDWCIAPLVRLFHMGSRYENTTYALKTVCERELVPEEFVFLNDDMFAMQPTEIPNWHLGPIRRRMARYAQHGLDSAYTRGMGRTGKLLEKWGVETPLSYEHHAPIVVKRDIMLEVILRNERDSDSVHPFHKRSAYANVAGVGGEYREHDIKTFVRGETPLNINLRLPDSPWVSTSDKAFDRTPGDQIRAAFPEPSRWEMEE